MAETEPYSPHETRMLALEMAVEFINGGKKAHYTVEDAIAVAKKFEGYLTSTPIKGYEVPMVVAGIRGRV